MSKTLVCIGGHADGQRFAATNDGHEYLYVHYYVSGKRFFAEYVRERLHEDGAIYDFWRSVDTTPGACMAILLQHYRPRFIGFGGDTWEVATPLTGHFNKPMEGPASFAFVLILKRGGLKIARLEPAGVDDEFPSEADARAAGKRFAESLGIEVAE